MSYFSYLPTCRHAKISTKLIRETHGNTRKKMINNYYYKDLEKLGKLSSCVY